ncbi:MAG: Fe2+-dependent dioxygenase [Gammaproteobacteria bacterium]|nr:MAG: Fe2+-dependent dioxygenase [Gammaproteobacteria bacterium]
MLIKIPDILDTSKLSNIRKILDNAKFVDGKLSAGKHAKRIKNNEEMDQKSQQAQYLDQLVVGSLAENNTFRSAALPHKVSRPFFARYTKGMAYGDHIDDPVMGSTAGERYRTDISVTVFLNQPDDYEGGELVINTSFGQQKMKLPAGHAILYPSSSLHQVTEISKGERRVAILWLQSMVRDPARRELLYNLNLARESLMQSQPDARETAQVDHSYVNLVRLWSEI